MSIRPTILFFQTGSPVLARRKLAVRVARDFGILHDAWRRWVHREFDLDGGLIEAALPAWGVMERLSGGVK